MKSTLSAFISGLVFGFGLILSEMVNPKRVQGFLDITGQWDLTLAFVMGGALLVTAIGYKVLFTKQKPLFETSFSIPGNRMLDAKLIIGAALFGVGWGLSGLCPGPALVGLATLNQDIVLFIVAMMIGMKVVVMTEKPRL